MTNPRLKISWYKFDTVTHPEVLKMMENPKFLFFFKGLDDLADIDGFPLMWLISSIDRSSADGQLRFPKEGGNHVDSHAVDIVPLQYDENKNKIIRLPIPLNRNLLLHNVFRTVFTGSATSSYPFIAFESDHIHVDINHIGDVVYLNKVRGRLDSVLNNWLTRARHPKLRQAIDNGKLYSTGKLF